MSEIVSERKQELPVLTRKMPCGIPERFPSETPRGISGETLVHAFQQFRVHPQMFRRNLDGKIPDLTP